MEALLKNTEDDNMKIFILLATLFILLPGVIALDERIIETELTIEYDASTRNITLTVEDDSGHKDYVWHVLLINNSGNITGIDLDMDEDIEIQFIRELDDIEECKLTAIIKNQTEICTHKIEAYDRLVGERDVKSQIDEKFVDLNHLLKNSTEGFQAQLTQCHSDKSSCEASKKTLFTQAQVDKELEGKYGLGWIALALIAPIAWYNRKKFGGRDTPKIQKNQPQVVSRRRF